MSSAWWDYPHSETIFGRTSFWYSIYHIFFSESKVIFLVFLYTELTSTNWKVPLLIIKWPAQKSSPRPPGCKSKTHATEQFRDESLVVAHTILFFILYSQRSLICHSQYYATFVLFNYENWLYLHNSIGSINQDKKSYLAYIFILR
jgi:hypothetical protein